MEVLFVLILLLLSALLSCGTYNTHVPGCLLPSLKPKVYSRRGDLILGALLPLHAISVSPVLTFTEPPAERHCEMFDIMAYQDILSMVFAVNEINHYHSVRLNLTVGFKIYDSCSTEAVAIWNILWLLSGDKHLVPNFSCEIQSKVIGMVGDLLSSTSLPVARLLGPYRFPQISHGAGLPLLSDKLQFPSFLRTVPNAQMQPYALAQFMTHFGWSWVGILYAGNDFGVQGGQQLKEELVKVGICVAFYEMLPMNIPKSKAFLLAEVIKRSSANVIVFYAFSSQVAVMMEAVSSQNITKKVWIAILTWIIDPLFSKKEFQKVLNGTVGLTYYGGDIPGFSEYLYSIHPSDYPDDIFIKQFWETAFSCQWLEKEGQQMTAKQRLSQTKICTGEEQTYALNIAGFETESFRHSYGTYTAVYSLMSALHDLISCIFGKGPFANASCADIDTFQHWQLLHYVKNVHFTNKGGQKVSYDVNGDGPAVFDLLNWQLREDGSMKLIKIGQYKPSEPKEESLFINDTAIWWSGSYTQVPKSVCSESCPTGYRKSPRQGEPVCCYDCMPCTAGEIANQSDSTMCLQCPWNFWSNDNQDKCVEKSIEFLSLEEPIGTGLVATTIFLSLLPLSVQVIFIKYRDTPLVRANNRELSFFLLFILMLSFLCCLIFIGHPDHFSCKTRQVAFGLTFSISVSAILAKTITVLIAFKATNPSSKLRKWVGPKTPYFLLISCSFLQGVICLIWISNNPPFPAVNAKSYREKLIIECHEGSTSMFYVMLGYLGLLACVSFILAFLARKLPDTFNEAKLITFSMLVFVIVWLSFIPAYLSVKGKYVVAVEVFAMLSSTSGLLCCIFLPKCYIILLRPELNTKEHLTGKSQYSA